MSYNGRMPDTNIAEPLDVRTELKTLKARFEESQHAQEMNAERFYNTRMMPLEAQSAITTARAWMAVGFSIGALIAVMVLLVTILVLHAH